MLNLLNNSEQQEIIDYCSSKYGLTPSHWEKFEMRKSSEAIWIAPKELGIFLSEQAIGDCETAGTRIFSGKKFPYKITDSFISLFGESLNSGVIELRGEQVKKLLFKKEIILEDEYRGLEGYVVIKFKDYFVGVGLKRGSKIDSQIPKKLVNQLSEKLELRD